MHAADNEATPTDLLQTAGWQHWSCVPVGLQLVSVLSVICVSRATQVRKFCHVIRVDFFLRSVVLVCKPVNRERDDKDC